MDKFPKLELNGQKPIVTPANEVTLQQFENVVKKQRKSPEAKLENTNVRQPPPSIPIGQFDF